jgi:hypothetical protein
LRQLDGGVTRAVIIRSLHHAGDIAEFERGLRLERLTGRRDGRETT